MSELSFRERVIWLFLVVNMLVYGNYFVNLWGQLQSGETAYDQLLEPLLYVLIFAAVVEVAVRVILAVGSGKEEVDAPEDERDELIDLKATKNAYFMLCFGIFTAGANLLVGYEPLLIVNLLLLFVVLSEMTKYGSELFYYRRGV
jgi:hypothetical protein